VGANNHLDKKCVLALLEEAIELQRLYDAENRRHPKQVFDYGGSVDEIALGLLERRGYFVTISIDGKSNSNEVSIFGRECYPGSDKFLALGGNTVKYTFTGIEGTTVSRFVATICDVIDDRVNNGNKELKAAMPSNVMHATKGVRDYYLPR